MDNIEKMNLYQKLIEVRKAVPYLQKSEKGHRFNFVSSSHTLSALKEKMDEMGVLLVPSVIESEVRDHATQAGKHEYFTILMMSFTWVNSDNPEETITCSWTGQGLDSGEKGVGKAMTYAEKYFMLKFFNIPTDKDDPDSFQRRNTPVEIITKDQIEEIKAMLPVAGISEKDFLAKGNYKSFAVVPSESFARMVNWLNIVIDKREVKNANNK